jgi:hypothetical protein
VGGPLGALTARMEAELHALEAVGDPAHFFLGTYLRLTRAIEAELDRGGFADAEWVAAWDVAFAELYLAALAAHRAGRVTAEPWRLAFGADPGLRPEAHVLFGVNAHVNFDQPQSLLAVVPPADVDDPGVLARRRADSDRIDAVIADSVAAEDRALQRGGSRRTVLDRAATPVNRLAVRLFMAEARRKVWANTLQLDAARRRGPAAYRARVADLERVSAQRVADLRRPGPVLLRLAARGFGVALDPAPGGAGS